MEISKILNELREERDLIDEAIFKLTQLASTRLRPIPVDGVAVKRKRGRPPGSRNRPKPSAVVFGERDIDPTKMGMASQGS
jgi:hypothetical protein